MSLSRRAADRSHLPARRTSTKEPLAAVGFEPGHVHPRWHIDFLQHLPGLGIDSSQLALASFQGAVPQLSVDPGDAGHEAVGFDCAQNLSRLRVDLMDLAITILSYPQRSLGPCEPRVAATAGCRDGGEDLSGRGIDLLDAILRDLKEMLPIERGPGMRRDVEGSLCLTARRIEGLERVSRSKPDLLTVVGHAVHVLDARESVLTKDLCR